VTIGYDGVLPLLIAACPTFANSPEADLHDEGSGEFLRVAALVSHMIRLLESGRTECFADVFRVAEHILSEGHAEARSLIVAGFLRDLASPDMYGGTAVQPVDFLVWLEPRSREEFEP
jgi:hypothetical protein